MCIVVAPLVAAGIAAGVSAAGAAAGAVMAARSADNQAKVENAQATIAGQQANAAQDTGLYNAQIAYRQGAQRMGALRAQMAANGVDISGGSALQEQQGLASTTGMDAGQSMYEANAQASAFRNQAASADNQASAAHASATNSLIGGSISAAGSIASFSTQNWGDLMGGSTETSTMQVVPHATLGTLATGYSAA